MKKRKLTIIKLGGSVITDKKNPFSAREEVIARLAKEIKTTQKGYKGELLLAHGGGSFPHSVASKYKTHKGLNVKDGVRGAVLTSDAAIEINRIVMKQLIKVGLSVKPFVPASFLIAKKGKPTKIFSEPILHTLSTDIIPVFYGDVVMDTEQGVSVVSTETIIHSLLRNITKSYKIERIIYCVDTDGVYDSKGKTINKITSKNIGKLRKEIGTSGGRDVTGGMLHKVEDSLQVVRKYETSVLLVNGTIDGIIPESVIENIERGTKISR